MRKALFTTSFYFAVALVATSAFIEPPVLSWRGNGGTTFQERLFDTTDSAPVPDTTHPYAASTNPAVPQVDADHGRYGPAGLDQGVWALSGETNHYSDNNYFSGCSSIRRLSGCEKTQSISDRQVVYPRVRPVETSQGRV